MAIAPVQQKFSGTTSNTNPTNTTFTSTTTTGNLLVAVLFSNVITVTGVTDSVGNTWSLSSSSVNFTGSWSRYVYICANATGGASHQVRVATSGTGWTLWTGLHEFSGAATASPIESTTATTGYTSANPNTNPTNGVAITTTNATDYVMGLFAANTTTTFTAATGWTLLNTGNASLTFCTVGQVETSTGTYTPQVKEAITSWAGFTWSLAIIAGGAATLSVTVSDSVTLTENVATTLAFNVNVSDSVTLSENVATTLAFNASVSDSITVTDTPSLLESSFVNVNDSVTITESLKELPISFVNVSDSITVTESSTIQPPITAINVSETVTVTESVTLVIPISVNNTESVTVTDTPALLVPILFVAVSESIVVSENSIPDLTVGIDVEPGPAYTINGLKVV